MVISQCNMGMGSEVGFLDRSAEFGWTLYSILTLMSLIVMISRTALNFQGFFFYCKCSLWNFRVGSTDVSDESHHSFFSSQLAQERALPVGPERGGLGMSYDLPYGRAGFLWAALFINKYLGEDTIPKELANADRGGCPCWRQGRGIWYSSLSLNVQVARDSFPWSSKWARWDPASPHPLPTPRAKRRGC